MRIVTKHIDELLPAAYNPRKDLQPGDPAYERLKKSIIEFDYVDPVIWNQRSGKIIGGHQRLKILQELGEKKIQVSVVDLPEEKEKALNLALNKIEGEWDIPRLEDLLAEIETFDFADIEVTGFDADEIEAILRGDSNRKDGLTDPDDVPELPTEPITKPGDIWLLGEHRVMCGDSRDAEDVARLMDGKRATLFSTDPPYLVDYTGADRPDNSGKDWTDRYNEIAMGDAEAFFRDVFNIALNVTEDNAAWYVWHSHKRTGLIQGIWEELGILNHQQIIWHKPTATHCYSYYPWQHEPCMMGWKQGNKPRHDGDHSHDLTSVWELDWEGKSRIIGNEHPTQKPVGLFAIPMQKHTLKGEICFEPFCGSGSQVIAGEQMGRVVYAMDISPVFVDVAVKRWEEFLGKKAILESTGSEPSCA